MSHAISTTRSPLCRALLAGRGPTSSSRAASSSSSSSPSPSRVAPPSSSSSSSSRATTIVVRAAFGGKGKRPKLPLDVDDAVKGGVGGAVLGGLLLGPFGAILGANFGANLGADKRRAKQEEAALLKRGITRELLDAVTNCAESLRDAEEALATAKESYALALEEASALDREAIELYERASEAVAAGADDDARRFLTARKKTLGSLEDAKDRARSALERVNRVQGSVETLATQAKRLEGILRDQMAAAAETNAAEAARKFASDGDAYDAASGSATELEDPLERRFRELEGK